MRSRVRLSAVVAAVLLVVFSACGDDEPGEAGDSTSSGSSSEATDGSDSSASTEPSESSDGRDRDYPVEGPVNDHDSFSIRLPTPEALGVEDFDWIQRGGTFSILLDEGDFSVTAGDLRTTRNDLDHLAQVAEESSQTQDPPLKRVENRTHDGVEFYVLQGRNADDYDTTIGGIRAGYQWDINFYLPADWSEADAWIDAMIASIEWKTPAP